MLSRFARPPSLARPARPPVRPALPVRVVPTRARPSATPPPPQLQTEASPEPPRGNNETLESPQVSQTPQPVPVAASPDIHSVPKGAAEGHSDACGSSCQHQHGTPHRAPPAAAPPPDVKTLEELVKCTAGIGFCKSTNERVVTAWLVAVFQTLMDLLHVLQHRKAELTEPFLLAMVEWVERTAVFHLIDSTEYTYSFTFSPHYRGQAIPPSEFGNLKRQGKNKAAASSDGATYHTMEPMRLSLIDELGKMWVSLHGHLAAVDGSRLAADCDGMTYADLVAELPELPVLCSGSGVQQNRHADLVALQRCPETAYFNTRLPDVEPARPLTLLTFNELAQTLQVINFCKYSLDYLGRVTTCMRVLVVTLARCLQFTPPKLDTAAVIRRQMVLLIGMLADTRRVHRILRPAGLPRVECEIDADEETLAPLCALLATAATMNFTDKASKEVAMHISAMIVRRHDNATYRSVDVRGLKDPNMIAAEMWGQTYGDIYNALTNQSYEALLAYKNLAPEFRIVITLFVFQNYYTNACSGDPEFYQKYTRLQDTVFDGSRAIYSLTTGRLPSRMNGTTYQPIFVCVGNVFGVHYKDRIYTADNDAVRLLYKFLVILKEDWQCGATQARDLYGVMRTCKIISDVEHAATEKEDTQEDRRLQEAYQARQTSKGGAARNWRPGGKYE